MQVCVHELVDHVHIVELVLAGGRHDVQDANDVLVPKVAQQLDLTQRSPGVRQVLERVACVWGSVGVWSV